MLNDPKIMSAVSNILQRSERQQDLQKLVGSFVDVGILPQLDSGNNQINIWSPRNWQNSHLAST
jgi:hypothetical protein